MQGQKETEFSSKIQAFRRSAQENGLKTSSDVLHFKVSSANKDENKYDVLIATPSGPVFDATVSFNRQHGLARTTTTGITATLKRGINKYIS